MSFFVFSGTLMLQLDGFPTGDGVKVKVFIHISQSVLTPTQGCDVLPQNQNTLLSLSKKNTAKLSQPWSGVSLNKNPSI